MFIELTCGRRANSKFDRLDHLAGCRHPHQTPNIVLIANEIEWAVSAEAAGLLKSGEYDKPDDLILFLVRKSENKNEPVEKYEFFKAPNVIPNTATF